MFCYGKYSAIKIEDLNPIILIQWFLSHSPKIDILEDSSDTAQVTREVSGQQRAEVTTDKAITMNIHQSVNQIALSS